ncbi:uncharacterized protein LOC111271911 isoform X1 [Varroa jacobsoni]|uniref:uncharacterized protein LOC111271911 isoform X1 n=1 Tax=Varroa jacobsoni TaxID=62625 RepID=UPI000BF5EEAB|nr:uncharacterized protein LOC111271911 isoform X1 [Varroa jacobsoni]XP_022708693.1 uncharacterized protein LOC111271911 isoform X1 [Varroa jacobsoni]XP_022708694.1 uncharacterized protein LOC111271911 isoform X1 [Varroa jacobsoni]XP_022708695.1 uncharacterized protein LOC111271911 isoform X1 [Varroa jacobsoni]XP_022708696.1 uncharacterized protein LOC111271911 isoform X1 [Varroa jacobsoni]
MTIAKFIGYPQKMAGWERDTREKEPLDAEGAPTVQGNSGQDSQGARPERAAAQLCQLKLKYEYSPQSPSKRRTDISEQAPCSPSVETLLTATVRRVELEVAKEFGPETKRSRDDRTPSIDGRSDRMPPQDAGSKTQDRETSLTAPRKVTNGERRSSDSAAIIVQKRKDMDSPISPSVTRSQVWEEEATPKEAKIRADVVSKCNGNMVIKNSNLKTVISKTVIAKVTATDISNNTSQQTMASVKVVVAPKAAAVKRESPSPDKTDEEKRSKNPETIPVKTLSKAKTSMDVCPLGGTSTPSNGTCTKSLKIGKKETTIDAIFESDLKIKPLGKGGNENTPVKIPTTKTRSEMALTTPSSNNGVGVSLKSESDPANSEVSTPKIIRTTTVNARKLAVGDDYTTVAADLTSTKTEAEECHQVGQASITRAGNAVITAKRTIRELSANEALESTPKKFVLGTSPVTAVNRRKDLDTPVLSPVMKDILDNPSSPMTRSMSRRMEETTVPGIDSGIGRSMQTSNSMETPSSSGSVGTASSDLSTLRAEEPPIKKRVRFDRVTVYLFERTQGFTSVPTQGGSTLGMGSIHQDLEEYSVEEHAERKRLQLRPTGVPTPPLVLPIPTKRRRELLRQSGVRDIDALEKDECESIRASRERCGCACQGRCEPIVCLCILAGISCQVEVFSQVDRSSFPCGCSREGCDNPNGRTEFDPIKVKAYVQQTRLRANREMGLPEEQIQVMQNRVEQTTCEYSSEGSDNSSECSENSDYASSDEAIPPVQLSSVSLHEDIELPAHSAKDATVSSISQVHAKEEPSEDSGNSGGTSVDSVQS